MTAVAQPAARLAPRQWVELGAVALTAAGHLASPLLPVPRIVFTSVAVLAWGAWLATRDRETLRGWGLTRKNLVPAFTAATAFAAPAALAMFAWGWFTGEGLVPAHAVICLIVYPAWGLVQQLLVQGLVTKNLVEVGGRPAAAVVVSSALFGLVHWPYPVLMVATFGLGLVFAPLWLRWRNLWPLALYHGWLGTILYYQVIGEDPLRRVLGL